MDDNSVFHLIVLITGQNDIRPVLKRHSVRKTLQRFSSHYDYLSRGRLAEKLHI